MRLDHISYVASHDQISDVVNRIGSQIGTAFVDGGIHPKFGTRNFTAPLLNGQYIEVVCPMDHPATDTTPFGSAVRLKAEVGGGWMAWVYSVEQILKYENLFERKSTLGKRIKPNGQELIWQQIGLIESIQNPCLPYVIKWNNSHHPSGDGQPIAAIHKIKINFIGDTTPKIIETYGVNIDSQIELKKLTEKNDVEGIAGIEFRINEELVLID